MDLILDGAHNLHAARQLVLTWREKFGDQKCRLIFGALSDKDPQSMLAILEPLAHEVLLVPVDSPRSFHPEHYLEQLQMPQRCYESLGLALSAVTALSVENPTGVKLPVLLTGSLFLVGEALAMCSGCGSACRNQSQ